MSLNKKQYYTSGRTLKSKGNQSMLNAIERNAYSPTRKLSTKRESFVNPELDEMKCGGLTKMGYGDEVLKTWAENWKPVAGDDSTRVNPEWYTKMIENKGQPKVGQTYDDWWTSDGSTPGIRPDKRVWDGEKWVESETKVSANIPRNLGELKQYMLNTPSQLRIPTTEGYDDPRFYKYGYANFNPEGAVGGAGIGHIKSGLEANIGGFVPYDVFKNPYFKGDYNIGLKKNIGPLSVGTSFNIPIGGYTDEQGVFRMDRPRITPNLNLSLGLKTGGEVLELTDEEIQQLRAGGHIVVESKKKRKLAKASHGGEHDGEARLGYTRKDLNKAKEELANYMSYSEWNADGTPVTIDQKVKEYYDAARARDIAKQERWKNIVRNNDKSKRERFSLLRKDKEFKDFIKNTMDDIYSISGKKYDLDDGLSNQYQGIGNRNYQIASEDYSDSRMRFKYDPNDPDANSQGFVQEVELGETTVFNPNTSEKEKKNFFQKIKERRKKAQMINHVMAELTGSGDLPLSYSDDAEWQKFLDKYEEAVRNAKNEQLYIKELKDKDKKKGEYKGLSQWDANAKFKEKYDRNNWIQFDQNAYFEEEPGQYEFAADIDQERKRQSFEGLANTAIEMTGVPTIARVATAPVETLEDVVETGADLITAPFVEGDINPWTGEKYWANTEGLFDALGVAAPIIGIGGKVKPFNYTKPIKNWMRYTDDLDNVYIPQKQVQQTKQYTKTNADRTVPTRKGLKQTTLEDEFNTLANMNEVSGGRSVVPVQSYGDGVMIMDDLTDAGYQQLDEFIDAGGKVDEYAIRNLREDLTRWHSEGILHGDLKPNNIFYNSKTRELKVIDPAGYPIDLKSTNLKQFNNAAKQDLKSFDDIFDQGIIDKTKRLYRKVRPQGQIYGEGPGTNLTKQDVYEIKTEIKNWLTSDEYATRRMARTGETRAEVDEAVDLMLKKGEQANIHFGKDLGKKGPLGYQREAQPWDAAPKVKVSTRAGNKEREVLKHELLHQYSDTGVSPINEWYYQNYPLIGNIEKAPFKSTKFKNINTQSIFNPNIKTLSAYESLPFEQQVRGLALRDNLLAKNNLSVESSLTKEQVKEFTDDFITNSISYKNNDYYKLLVSEQKKIADEVLQKHGFKTIADAKGSGKATALNKEIADKFAASIQNWLNTLYAVPAIGITGALTYEDSQVPQQKYGGEVMELTDKEIEKLRKGGHIVIEQ